MKKEFYLVAGLSMGAGGCRLTLKNVPIELHKRIIKKHGDYQTMEDEAQDNYDQTLMEEFQNCKDVKPFETFYEENE